MAGPALNITDNPMEIQELVANSRPEHWFSEVFRYTPMDVKSLAMMTLLTGEQQNNETLTDPRFHFWQKPWNQRDCAVLDCYDAPGIAAGSETSGASASGAIVNLTMTAANTKLWTEGMHVIVTKFNEATFQRVVAEVVGKVTGVTVGTDSTSYITVRLAQADTDSALAGAYLRINPAGQSHPNIHTLPDGRVEQPTEYTGAVSTFLGSYAMDDITRKTKLRINTDMWQEAEADALKDFAIDKEMAFLESILSTSVANEYVTGGLRYYLSQYTTAGVNIVDAITDTNYLSASVTGPAYTWVYELLQGVMEYGSRWFGDHDFRCFHGGLVGTVINDMIRDKGVYNLGTTTGVDSFGFEFTRLKFQNGAIRFYSHPLFRNAPRYQGTMVLMMPENISQATFMPFETIPADVMNDERQKRARRDGTVWSSVAKGGFREVCGWKFQGMDGMFIIRNVRPDISRT